MFQIYQKVYIAEKDIKNFRYDVPHSMKTHVMLHENHQELHSSGLSFFVLLRNIQQNQISHYTAIFFTQVPIRA